MRLVSAIEVIGPRHRGTIGVLQGLLFGVGTMIISVLAYFFRHDYHMNLVMLTPNTLFLTYFVYVCYALVVIITILIILMQVLDTGHLKKVTIH